MKTLNPISDSQVERKSSIYQHRDLLSVMKRGEWCPIVFDQIIGVECGRLITEKVALRLRDGLNYTFPVKTCCYTNDTYLLTQQNRTVLKMLPEWFGDGFYEVRERGGYLTNIGNDALGVHNEKTLRVGQDYVMAKTTLKAVE